MSGNTAEPLAQRVKDPREGKQNSKAAQALGAITVGMAALFAALSLLGFEGHFLIYVANVFAGVMATGTLLLLLTRAALLALLKKTAGRRLFPLPLCALLVAAAVPVVQGELRRGEPAAPSSSAVDGGFTVLDANLFGPAEAGDDLLREVSELEPDIVMLQELNPRVAERLGALLGDRYPCKVLNAQNGTLGMGLYSRFPCSAQQPTRSYFAAGQPQFVTVMLPTGKRLAVANVHTNPPHVIPPHSGAKDLLAAMSETVALREQHAENLLAELSAMPADGQLVAGDFNATVRNRVYGIMRNGGMADAWGAAGRLSGGTWPNLPIIRWLLRLDFLFCSESLVPLTAENLTTDGGSDHRGLLVRLGWRAPA